MNRYRAAPTADDASLEEADRAFIGVNSYDSRENLQPGQVQSATNIDFSDGSGATRPGFVCIPTLGNAPFDAAATWTTRTNPAPTLRWRSVAHGNGVFVAVGDTAPAGATIYSADGTTWSVGTHPVGNTSAWASVAYGGGKFVAVSNGGEAANVMVSSDGRTWSAVTSGNTSAWQAVTYGGGKFVAVGSTAGVANQVMVSSDLGTTWTTASSAADKAWKSVTYGDGRFVAVATTSGTASAMYSTSGTSWTAGTSISGAWNAVAFGSATFVAVGDTGAVQTSTDGSAWTTRTAAESNDWDALAFGNSLFVAVSSSGTNRVQTSPNGITWTARSAASASTWSGIVNAQNTLVAVASDTTATNIMTAGATSSVWASGVYSDPDDTGSRYTMLVGTDEVGFYAFGKTSKSVAIDSAETVTEQSTVVQANNQVFIFRGMDETPLVWDGIWGNEFELATGSIPNATKAIYCQNRLWAITSKDTLQTSDVLGFTVWNNLDSSFNLSKGDSDYLVTMYPFGDTSLVVFKNNSILLLTGIDGALNDIVCTEITRTVGCVGINAVTSVGPDLVYVSDRNINLLSLTDTNNSLQHDTLPLSRNLKAIWKRVNWEYGYKVSLAFWDNKLFVALPLDNATTCNTVCVYNFITEQWYGEWSFDSAISMNVQGWVIANYLGEQRLHCTTEDGRIFVVGDGFYDVSGTTLANISTSITTRALRMNDNTRFNRRLWVDIGTNRPEFSVSSFSDGETESSALLTDQTFTRSQSWIASDSTYSLTNSGDNYNRAGRKDYGCLCSDSAQPQSGFYPERLQEIRLPLPTRRSGRLAWASVTNTQGKLVLRGLGFEARDGYRNNMVQVL